MATTDDIRWFKTRFAGQIQQAIAGTPLSLDFVVALACQETGEIWTALRASGLPDDQVVALCTGDTLDEDGGRRAFPRTRQQLVDFKPPLGQQMFDLGHQALVDMAAHIPAYSKVAKNPAKFCHGYGVFQLDLQFFREDPDYFLNRNYEKFDHTLGRCAGELKGALVTLGYESKTSLTDLEMTAVGIVYNTGGYNPKKGLKQGHFDGKRYYGENLFDFLRLAHTVGVAGADALLAAAEPGEAVIPPPSEVSAAGPAFRVQTLDGMLRLRREPQISDPPQANVLANLPGGHLVRAVTGTKVKGFIEVETSLRGALLRGFASAKFLVPVDGAVDIKPVTALSAPPIAGIVAVTMPRKAGTVTRRRDPAGAHSLNEKNQPGRAGTTAEQLRAELGAIIDWLGVDDPANLRYQPQDGRTYCNIYAHDYCALAGVYLPRVWWTSAALLQLAAGNTVEPRYEDTIQEMRANDLSRWLRDFGPGFGWRATGTLNKLQMEVNQGAVGVIVARRKEDGRSGHIVMVVPETATETARRDASGEVLAPLQSQAGATNFRYGKGKPAWWTGSEFAEFTYWLHA